MGEKNTFKDFTKARSLFESFLLRHKNLVNQVVRKYGSGMKGSGWLKLLFERVFEGANSGLSEDQILTGLLKTNELAFLQPAEKEEQLVNAAEFSADTKSAAFLREALKNPVKCAICGGLMHTKSITIDHVQRKADGGAGTLQNAQLAHPYCNTTVKN